MSDMPRLTTQTLKVLGAFASEPQTELAGSDIAKRSSLSAGTLYPILARLERVGWLQSRWEKGNPCYLGRPLRRYYRMTTIGLERAAAVSSVIFVNRADDPLRNDAERAGERADRDGGRSIAEVVPLKPGKTGRALRP
jgi:PadR family transcriptional regulator, regulatory protein PadR